MGKLLSRTAIFSSLSFLLAAPASAQQVPQAPPSSIVSEKGISGVLELIARFSGWFYGIIIFLAIIFILVAAFNFLTSGGDEEKVKKARSYLIYAVVAVAVAVVSAGIITVTMQFFGGEVVPSGNGSQLPGGGVMCGSGEGEIFCPAPMRCVNNLCVQ
jgi:hypothetical protein